MRRETSVSPGRIEEPMGSTADVLTSGRRVGPNGVEDLVASVATYETGGQVEGSGSVEYGPPIGRY
jgi:hypothetical protein